MLFGRTKRFRSKLHVTPVGRCRNIAMQGAPTDARVSKRRINMSSLKPWNCEGRHAWHTSVLRSRGWRWKWANCAGIAKQIIWEQIEHRATSIRDTPFKCGNLDNCWQCVARSSGFGFCFAAASAPQLLQASAIAGDEYDVEVEVGDEAALALRSDDVAVAELEQNGDRDAAVELVDEKDGLTLVVVEPGV